MSDESRGLNGKRVKSGDRMDNIFQDNVGTFKEEFRNGLGYCEEIGEKITQDKCDECGKC